MSTSAKPRENGTFFFRNVACASFPCHAGVDVAEFNCLFCYCPLYALGERCGGDFAYTAGGIKDCTNCTRLHRGEDGVRMVREHFPQLAELARMQGPTAADDGASVEGSR